MKFITFPLLIVSTILSMKTCVPPVLAKERHVLCSNKQAQYLRVPFNDVMTLRLPDKPNHTVPGKNNFSFQFVENDILIKGQSPQASANYFVYLSGQRCSFRLTTVMGGADDMVFVKYPKEHTFEVRYGK